MAAVTQYADLCVLHTRQEATIEVKKDGSAVTVVFRLLGETGAPGSPVTVGAIPKAIPLELRERPNGELVITDGAKVISKSANGGKDWSPIQ